jgi:outer membrane protein assembly factor BamB
MKIPRLLILSLLLILAAALLSGCAGRSYLASSWPGLTISQAAGYLADNSFIYAINLENGSQIWKFPADKAEKGMSFFAAPGLTEDSQLIIGGYDHILYSLNANNGTLLWSFAGADDRYIASPLVTSQYIFAPNANGKVYALDLKGGLKWTFNAGQSIWAQPATNENCDCLFVPSMDHHLYALEAETGSLIWKSPDLGAAVVSSPTFGEDGAIFVGTFGNEMLALDAKTGAIQWRAPSTGWVWSSPVLQNGKLFFGDLKGTFYVLDTAGKELQAPFKSDGLITGTPLVKGSTIFFGTENGTVYSMTSEGSTTPLANLASLVVNEKTLDGKINAPISAYNDLLLVAPSGSDALLVALTSTGTLQWSFSPAK